MFNEFSNDSHLFEATVGPGKAYTSQMNLVNISTASRVYSRITCVA